MGYSVINPSTQVEAIKQNWRLNHCINLFLLTTSLPFWFFTPFLTREITSNNWHKFFRFASISYAITASGTSLYLSTQLGKIKPKIDAINKREQAEFKHSLASDLYLAQSTNTAIAQYLLTDRTTSLSSENVTELEPLPERDGNENEEEVTELVTAPEPKGYTVTGTRNQSYDTELSPLAEEYIDAVMDALEDGLSDTKIIKEVLQFNGRNYQTGKKILAEIKRFLELDD